MKDSGPLHWTVLARHPAPLSGKARFGGRGWGNGGLGARSLRRRVSACRMLTIIDAWRGAAHVQGDRQRRKRRWTRTARVLQRHGEGLQSWRFNMRAAGRRRTRDPETGTSATTRFARRISQPFERSQDIEDLFVCAKSQEPARASTRSDLDRLAKRSGPRPTAKSTGSPRRSTTNVKARNGTALLRQDLRANQGLRMQLRQYRRRMRHRGVVCESAASRSYADRKCAAAHRAHRPRHRVARIWFLKSLPSRIGSAARHDAEGLEKVSAASCVLVTDP